MNARQPGLQIFAEVRPDEIWAVNLVLDCLANGRREIGPALRWLLTHSGISGRVISPTKSLDLALDLGLVVSENDQLELSDLGRDLMTIADWPPYNAFTEQQGLRLLDALLQRPDFANPLASLVRKMRRAAGGSLELIPGSTYLGHEETQCLRALQATNIIHYTAGALVLESTTYQRMLEVLGTPAVMSEDELLNFLERQRKRGLAAEHYVMRLEITTLTIGGRLDLAELVERVSFRDVSAGYDIRSFELNGSDKFIEVKSSTRADIKFVISRNELNFLEDHDDSAWIYFVPRAHELPSLTTAVIAIPTPAKWLDFIATIEPTDFAVTIPKIEGIFQNNEHFISYPRR